MAGVCDLRQVLQARLPSDEILFSGLRVGSKEPGQGAAQKREDNAAGKEEARETACTKDGRLHLGGHSEGVCRIRNHIVSQGVGDS